MVYYIPIESDDTALMWSNSTLHEFLIFYTIHRAYSRWENPHNKKDLTESQTSHDLLFITVMYEAEVCWLQCVDIAYRYKSLQQFIDEFTISLITILINYHFTMVLLPFKGLFSRTSAGIFILHVWL